MKLIRRAALVLVTVAAIAFAGSSGALAAPSDNSGQCPGATTIGNTPTSDGSIVLPAGLTICIHAGNGNTGQLVTDGVSTLADYILASGLVNNGGQVPGVSNYVVYGGEPSSQPSVEPSPDPTPSPTPSASPEPSPSSQPTPTPSPSPSSSATPEPTPSSEPTAPPTDVNPTLPPTDTETTSAGSDGSMPNWLLLLIVGAVVGGLVVSDPPGRGRSRR